MESEGREKVEREEEKIYKSPNKAMPLAIIPDGAGAQKPRDALWIQSSQLGCFLFPIHRFVIVNRIPFSYDGDARCLGVENLSTGS